MVFIVRLLYEESPSALDRIPNSAQHPAFDPHEVDEREDTGVEGAEDGGTHQIHVEIHVPVLVSVVDNGAGQLQLECDQTVQPQDHVRTVTDDKCEGDYGDGDARSPGTVRVTKLGHLPRGSCVELVRVRHSHRSGTWRNQGHGDLSQPELGVLPQ